MINLHANIQHAASALPAPRSDYTNQMPLIPLPDVGPHAEDVKTIRYPASANLMIDSLDRYPFQFGSLQQPTVPLQQPGNNFTLQSQEALIYGYFTRLAITQVYLKYNVPTVVDISDTAGVGNNIFTVIQTGSPSQQIRIPAGFYTAQTLAAAITTQFAAAPAPYDTYTCTWNATAAAFQFQSNNGQPFIFAASVFGAAALNPGTNPAVRCKYLLGITASNMQPTGTPATVQLCGPPRLYYTSFVDIVSQRLTKYQKVSDSESASGLTRQQAGVFPAIQNIVARVYLVPPNQRIASDVSGSPTPGSAPFDLVVDYNTPKHIRWSPNEAVYELDFQLYDQFGQKLYWSPKNPTEFCLTMHASES